MRVEVPHWAALVRVFDGRGSVRRQADEMPLELTGSAPGLWQASTRLPYGLYEVELLVNQRATRQVAVIASPDGCQLTQDSWLLALPLKSAAPLAGLATSRETHTGPAEVWSRQPTRTSASGNSGLFVFVRTLTPEKRTRWFDNLSLLDARGKVVTTFSEGIERDKRAGWMAFNASLPAGFYVLKRQGYGAHRTCHQPLYLSEGWQTQAFLEAKQRPSLRTLTLNLVPLGSGFRADDPAALAAALLLDSLKRSADPDRLVMVNTIRSLLGDRIENPWLRMLVAYVIRLQQDQLLPDDAEPSELWPPIGQWLPDLLTGLAAFGDHPDVQALRLEKNKPAEVPVRFPPLLYAGLRRVQQHALRFAETIERGSLLERILPRVATTTAWTAWRHAVHVSKPSKPAKSALPESDVGLEMDPAESPAPVPRITSRSPGYLRAVSPKLPIYQVETGTGPGTSATWQLAGRSPAFLPSNAEILRNATMLQVAETVTLSDETPDLSVQYDSTERLNTLLETATARIDQISQASGLPVAQVQSSLDKLQRTNQRSAKTAKRLSPFDQTVLSCALQKAIESNTGDPLLITIEECVTKLLGEAERLSLRLAGGALWPAVAPLIGRINALADQLLLAATFVVITDPEGTVQFGNGVFVTLLNQEGQVNPSLPPDDQPLLPWTSFFKSAPFGQSNLPDGLLRKYAGGDWELQRTVLHDKAHNQSLYVNAFRNRAGLRLTPAMLKDFEPYLPKLALPVASLAYGQWSAAESPGESANNQIEKLAQVIDRMERVLKPA